MSFFELRNSFEFREGPFGRLGWSPGLSWGRLGPCRRLGHNLAVLFGILEAILGDLRAVLAPKLGPRWPSWRQNGGNMVQHGRKIANISMVFGGLGMNALNYAKPKNFMEILGPEPGEGGQDCDIFCGPELV